MSGGLMEFLLARIAEDERDWTANPHAWDEIQYMLTGLTQERMFAECEAKRRIIALHTPCDDWSYGDASTCPELIALAQPYADHPDFRQEWKP